MVKVGFIGLGKLGLPGALAIEAKGHEVAGYDVNPAINEYLVNRHVPFREEGLQPLLDKTNLQLMNIDTLITWSDIVFCAVQTPHKRKYEGITRLPDDRKDFDYKYLKKAIKSVAMAAKRQKKKTILVVISTCLPGTFNREIKPLLNEYIEYIYNPWFIAMGTVLQDVYNPEFVLLGGKNDKLTSLYSTIHRKPLLYTDITTAEAIKVSYNTFITTKTVLGNLWGEIAHKTGANVDDIFKAWSMATDRLLSSKYLKSGVGDGGGCHPRDNIALSYIADELGLSFNYFEALMKARENHMGWIAKLAIEQAEDLPIFVLGEAFKPETNLTTGSPATLLANIISETHNVTIIPEPHLPLEKGVYIIGVKHEIYKDVVFPDGSKIIDPFGIIKDREGIEVTRIGRK